MAIKLDIKTDEKSNFTASRLNSSTNALEIRDLNFYYGGYHALKNISFDIAHRQVTAFIGPSGCGKSTLLRTLNRMYDLYPNQVATGEINFHGEKQT